MAFPRKITVTKETRSPEPANRDAVVTLNEENSSHHQYSSTALSQYCLASSVRIEKPAYQTKDYTQNSTEPRPWKDLKGDTFKRCSFSMPPNFREACAFTGRPRIDKSICIHTIPIQITTPQCLSFHHILKNLATCNHNPALANISMVTGSHDSSFSMLAIMQIHTNLVQFTYEKREGNY